MQKSANNSRPINTARTVNKLQQKRICEIPDRGNPGDMSQKKIKSNNRNLHEVRTVDALGNQAQEKKVILLHNAVLFCYNNIIAKVKIMFMLLFTNVICV